MKQKLGWVLVGSLFLTVGCAAMGMNSVQKLSQLSPGMSSDQVVEILGEPESSQMTEDKWILNYTLHENWKGFVPYFVVFDKDTRRLEAWFEDEEGYQRAQAQMGETFAPILEAAEQESGGGGAAPAGPNDPDLQKWITGNYYYFSSSQVVSASSEESLVLCVDGRFRQTGEFSASGTRDSGGNTGWGAASQGGNGGRWTISGDRQSGTITLTYGNGATRSVPYRVGSQAEQTMYFGQRMYAYAGVADCG
jgi:hypothetical protein